MALATIATTCIAVLIAWLIMRRRPGWLWGLLALVVSLLLAWFAGIFAGWTLAPPSDLASDVARQHAITRIVGSSFWSAVFGALIGLVIGRVSRRKPTAK